MKKNQLTGLIDLHLQNKLTMMNLAERIRSFEMLGDLLRRYDENSSGEEMQPLIRAAQSASAENQWFTHEQIRVALNNLGESLDGENLNQWLSPYKERIAQIKAGRKISVVMAGNIPAVGFHDFLCVLISGYKLIAKLSSSDRWLIPAMADILTGYMPEWHNFIDFTEGRLENFDAVIATGSTNTSRYFEFYFGKYPHIIRKNRNSVAVLSGREDLPELNYLANDIMLFFGMGCRSISKLYVPAGYDFSALVKALGRYGHYAAHHKYHNNYEYNKSIFLVSRIGYTDTGFLLLREDQEISSRIAVLHYEYYNDPGEVVKSIAVNAGDIQCVISNMLLPVTTVVPGQGQKPALWQYADHVDTIEFLLSLI